MSDLSICHKDWYVLVKDCHMESKSVQRQLKWKCGPKLKMNNARKELGHCQRNTSYYVDLALERSVA